MVSLYACYAGGGGGLGSSFCVDVERRGVCVFLFRVCMRDMGGQSNKEKEVYSGYMY